MGEVYKARDGKLNRDVAIKVLPESVARDADRLARFQREAQVLASLNHPHIAAIYGLEKSGDLEALVLEFVGGETLAERIAGGPVPVDEALAIARQIAGALEAAHEKGIVHRDLKPANVKVTHEGQVKVLDFGLAKALTGDASSPDVTHSPTITAQATQAGVVMGTAGYMSPEQARGKAVDKRADIWAFGVVVYEMLTGEKAFEGETVSDVLAGVLRAEIDFTRLPPGTPPGVRDMLRRCLDRDPKHRLRDIGDARIALEDLASSASGRIAAAETAAPPTPAPRAIWPWGVAILAALALGAVAGRFALAPRRSTSRPVRFEIGVPAVSTAAISPDGRQLAIASRGRLLVRDLDRLELREIAGADGAIRPFWSPDSRTIAYGAKGKLWKVAAEGGTPTVICELKGGLWDEDAGGAWMPDGRIVYSDGNTALFQVSAQGGDPVVALKPDPKQELHFHAASPLPAGKGFVFVVHRSGEGTGNNTIAVWSGGKPRYVLEASGQAVEDAVYSPTGHILFQRSPTNSGVWALPFSLSDLKATGEPFLVSPGMRDPSVSADGTLVVLPPLRVRPVNLVWADAEGRVVSRIGEPALRERAAVISPDGKRVAVAEDVDGKVDIWAYEVEGGGRRRLTNEGETSGPFWLPDGSVAYDSFSTVRRSGRILKRVLADGSGRAQEIGPGGGGAVSGDGRLFYIVADQQGWHLWHRSLKDEKEKPAPFLPQAFYNVQAAPSRDGRFVAYEAWTDANSSEIYVRRFPTSEGVWQVSTNGGTSPRWSADGLLFFAKGPEIYEVSVAADPDVRVSAPKLVFKRTAPPGQGVPAAFDVAPDGKHFLIYELAGDAPDDRMTVTLNWFAELRPSGAAATGATNR